MRSITLKFPGVPMAHQSVRATKKGNFFQPKEVKQKKDTWSWQAVKQLPLDFKAFSDMAIIEELTFIFPLLKNATKKVKDQIMNGEIVYKKTKPDITDNLQKGFIDSLNGIVYRDDSIIVEENCVRKIFGYNAGIILKIKGI